MAFLNEFPHGKELITISHACERIGVSRRTIYNWMKTNKIDYCRTIGGNVRIIADTLFRTIDKSDSVSNFPK